jgi:hypothetical protein
VVLLVLLGQEGVVKVNTYFESVSETDYVVFLASVIDELKVEGSDCVIVLDMDGKAHTTQAVT